jgi:hypothetical protein
MLDLFARKISEENVYKILEELVKIMIAQYPYQETYVMCADLYKILGDESKYMELTKRARSLANSKNIGYYVAS